MTTFRELSPEARGAFLAKHAEVFPLVSNDAVVHLICDTIDETFERLSSLSPRSDAHQRETLLAAALIDYANKAFAVLAETYETEALLETFAASGRPSIAGLLKRFNTISGQILSHMIRRSDLDDLKKELLR